MARRSIDIKIQEKGRDQGKLFKITEMSAFDTEAWASRTINAILQNAPNHEKVKLLPLVYTYVNEINKEPNLEEIIENIESGHAAHLKSTESLAIYLSSLFFQMPYDNLKMATDPLLQCCSIYLNPGQMDVSEPVMNNPNQYIEEPSTSYALYREAFKLHTDFFTQKIAQILFSSEL